MQDIQHVHDGHGNAKYLFTSQRLGFRCWEDRDILPMSRINADPQTMEYFPGLQSMEQTRDFVERMRRQFAEKGYCYFAVDRLADEQFLGFIGLSEQRFESAFTPAKDIGWRLRSDAWGSGYATEGAVACLEYGFKILGMNEIIAITPEANRRSERVMEKAGMTKAGSFVHPKLLDHERLRNCVVYKALKPE